jgi:hypothetical protein
MAAPVSYYASVSELTSACISVVSDVQERVRDLGSPLRFMLRRSSLVECVSVLHGTCLQCADFFFIHQYVQPCLYLFWHTDTNFCFYAEVNFWDFARKTVRLNETRFGPKQKSSPIYLGPNNLDTFWCTGWAWNCQIILDVGEKVRDLGSPLRFMLRRSSLVECTSVLHGTCLQCAEFFLSVSMCSHVCQKFPPPLQVKWSFPK